jgi:hypothetical protein
MHGHRHLPGHRTVHDLHGPGGAVQAGPVDQLRRALALLSTRGASASRNRVRGGAFSLKQQAGMQQRERWRMQAARSTRNGSPRPELMSSRCVSKGWSRGDCNSRRLCCGPLLGATPPQSRKWRNRVPAATWPSSRGRLGGLGGISTRIRTGCSGEAALRAANVSGHRKRAACSPRRRRPIMQLISSGMGGQWQW